MRLLVAIALMLLQPIGLVAEPDAKSGSLCVARLSDTAEAVDRDFPDGKPRRQFQYQFAVEINGRPPVAVSRESSQLISGLPTGVTHRIRILDAGEVIESFAFTFEKRGSNHLCLSYTPWYQTWSLEKPGRRPWCKCPAPAA